MAKEYIEREYLVKEAEAVLDFRKKYYTDKARIADAASTVEWLKYYAPAADVVEVVRCGECKHNVANWNHDELDVKDYTDITCDFFMTDGMCSDDFCSYGKRQEVDGDG